MNHKLKTVALAAMLAASLTACSTQSERVSYNLSQEADNFNDIRQITVISDDFGSIRTIEQDGKVLFCGRDIAAALGYANTKDALAKHCKGVANCYPLQTPGGVQEARFITEGDVYRLITHSRLPAAEQFERWVFDEVLPTIRRTGSYTMPAAQARHIAYLQDLQRSLNTWRGLEEKFSELTTEARQRYEQNRATRDECRAEVSKLERQIDDAILVLGAM